MQAQGPVASLPMYGYSIVKTYPHDPSAFTQVVAGLDERLGRLQASSDRVNAYTDRWCGAAINPTETSTPG